MTTYSEPEAVNRAVVTALARQADGKCAALRKALDTCESPIERRLALALVRIGSELCAPVDIPPHFVTHAMMPLSATVFPQFPIGRFRADLLCRLAHRERGAMHTVVVECDGHEFHEKTKDQAKRDKSRDRQLVAAGFPVLRFTGSEIYKDAESCALEVWGMLDAAMAKDVDEIEKKVTAHPAAEQEEA